MVRRGSTVRVRQRALQKPRKSGLSRSDRLAPGRSCGGYGAVFGAPRLRSDGSPVVERESRDEPAEPVDRRRALADSARGRRRAAGSPSHRERSRGRRETHVTLSLGVWATSRERNAQRAGFVRWLSSEESERPDACARAGRRVVPTGERHPSLLAILGLAWVGQLRRGEREPECGAAEGQFRRYPRP
jgi:hypothetical protein